IKACLGCFSCWSRTPGKCCLQDDMQMVIEKMLWADVMIWSFPLYYFSVPGPLKNLIDRQLPMVLPFMVSDAQSGSHPSRYDMSQKRHVVISTCGFYTAEGNYNGVTALFDHMCGAGNYTTIFCGQGELFRVPELHERTDEYLGYVTKAGEEYIDGGISEETKGRLEELLFPRKTFEQMADASWGIDRQSGEKEEDSLIFTRQMASLYRKEAYGGKDLTLEMYYTDIDRCYQIILESEGSRVVTDNFQTYTTRIETPYSVWKDIAAGKIRGDEALMQQKYRVKGDFDLMLKWDDYFGSASVGEENSRSVGQSGSKESGNKQLHVPEKGTSMSILLLPWIVFWVVASIDNRIGAIVSIACSALVPVLFQGHKKTIYDVLSGFFVTVCSLLLFLDVSARIVVPLSYLGFGLMWTLSCATKIPLTAHYSMNDYNGERALSNPLFMKTNRILTLLWGILYLATPVWTYFIMGTSVGSLTGAINSVLPALMGIFTAWFQKWYPAKVARG
ncbi:MAG: NAD(P)H-dependent oxidoreductase, partial [Lachnospiraceae bacterium]|nr:NAD(P)H-dependent oxidoreductase [Lachnospiraceae bacterium]